MTIDSRAASMLSSAQSSHVLNIVREAISNSMHHSCGAHGLVSVQPHRHIVRVMIKDDGHGFDASRSGPRGRGLRNIAARADELSARLDVRSGDGRGTRIVVDIPVQDKQGPRDDS
jgi:signal transduction histidine kinase